MIIVYTIKLQILQITSSEIVTIILIIFPCTNNDNVKILFKINYKTWFTGTLKWNMNRLSKIIRGKYNARFSVYQLLTNKADVLFPRQLQSN